MEWICTSPAPEAQLLFRNLVRSANLHGETVFAVVPLWASELQKFGLIKLLHVDQNHTVLRLRGYRFSGAA